MFLNSMRRRSPCLAGWRALLAFIQLGYLAMYALVLYKFHNLFRVSHELYRSATLGGVLLIVAMLGAPLRLYLLTAVILDYPDLRQKFRLLFPAILLLDLAWGATPMLFLGQLQASCSAMRFCACLPPVLTASPPLHCLRSQGRKVLSDTDAEIELTWWKY